MSEVPQDLQANLAEKAYPGTRAPQGLRVSEVPQGYQASLVKSDRLAIKVQQGLRVRGAIVDLLVHGVT